ncbi:putative signal transducing protein [Pendulispora albinea]|uniref:DUF2007 domain-containing protein n=1 Tax=Pendulispora albinea TaxID=2741071 RepID=A0ABZ2LUT9_9BACT
MDAEDLVVVATFGTVAEAELAKEILGNEGISAFLGNEMAAGLMPYLASGLGGITLQVQRQHAPRARGILAAPPDGAPAGDGLDRTNGD